MMKFSLRQFMHSILDPILSRDKLIGPLLGRDRSLSDVVRLDTGVSGHIHPAICITSNGILICVYCYAEFGPLLITRSTDGGKSWSVSAPFPHTDNKRIYPGSLTTLADNRIVHFWNVWAADTYGIQSRFVEYSISEDDGETWSVPIELDKCRTPAIDSYIRHSIVELSNQAWLLPLSNRTAVFYPETRTLTDFGDGQNHGGVPIVRSARQSFISGKGLRSTDCGKTWDVIELFPNIYSQGWRHEMLALRNGWLIASQIKGPDPGGNKIQFIVSRDDGQTWDIEHPVELYNPRRAIRGRACPRTVQIDNETLGTVFYDHASWQPGGAGMFFRRIEIFRLDKQH